MEDYMSMEIILTSSNAAAEIKLKEAAATTASTDISEAEATTNVITDATTATVTKDAATDTTATDTVVTDTTATDAAVTDTTVTDTAVAEGIDTTVTEEVTGDTAVADEAVTDTAVSEEVISEEIAGDVKVIAGEEVISDGSYVDPGYTEGMVVDPGMTQVKDPLLSSWPFVIGISLAVLFVSIALGAFLAKRKIKKGIEIYED
jgi:hypothetical protein